MAEEQLKQNTEEVIGTEVVSAAAVETETTDNSQNNRSNQRRGGGRQQQQRNRKRTGTPREKDEIESSIIEIRRVSRSYKGGKRLRISVCVAVGDHKGKVGIAIGKGIDVRAAQAKAIAAAKRGMVMVPVKGNTVPHDTSYKEGAAKVFLRPAVPGTGIIAGGAVRTVLELAGIKDVLSKVLGTRNKISNAYATVGALKSMRLQKL